MRGDRIHPEKNRLVLKATADSSRFFQFEQENNFWRFHPTRCNLSNQETLTKAQKAKDEAEALSKELASLRLSNWERESAARRRKQKAEEDLEIALRDYDEDVAVCVFLHICMS